MRKTKDINAVALGKRRMASLTPEERKANARAAAVARWARVQGADVFCDPDMVDIRECVICVKPLKADRKYVDTCGEKCYKMLLKIQRLQAENLGGKVGPTT